LNNLKRREKLAGKGGSQRKTPQKGASLVSVKNEGRSFRPKGAVWNEGRRAGKRLGMTSRKKRGGLGLEKKSLSREKKSTRAGKGSHEGGGEKDDNATEKRKTPPTGLRNRAARTKGNVLCREKGKSALRGKKEGSRRSLA